MAKDTLPIDLRSREVLARALDDYLALGVCQVPGAGPGVLRDVGIELALPDGTTWSCTGRVIRSMGDAGFLVQLDAAPDLDRLRRLAAGPVRVAEPALGPPPDAEPGPEAPAVTGFETDHSGVFARIRDLPLHEKHRLGRHGRRTVRQLLIKDPNKGVHASVVSNPEVSLDEILEYSLLPGLARDAIELIARNRTWMQSRQLGFNLVRNPSTPVELAVRLVPLLGPSEWRILARPGAVRMPISAAARKLLLTQPR